MQYFKVSITWDIKGVLKDELSSRDIGGPGFVQKNLTFSKLDEIITRNKFTTNHSTSEMEEQFLHLFEDRVYSEEDILIFLKE